MAVARLRTWPAFWFVPEVPVFKGKALPNDQGPYLARMAEDAQWGGQMEIVAIGAVYNIGFEFRHGRAQLGGSYHPALFKAYAFGGYGDGGIPQNGGAGKIRLYYHNNIHFQSLFNCAEDVGLAGSGCDDDAVANDPDPPRAPRRDPPPAPFRPSPAPGANAGGAGVQPAPTPGGRPGEPGTGSGSPVGTPDGVQPGSGGEPQEGGAATPSGAPRPGRTQHGT